MDYRVEIVSICVLGDKFSFLLLSSLTSSCTLTFFLKKNFLPPPEDANFRSAVFCRVPIVCNFLSLDQCLPMFVFVYWLCGVGILGEWWEYVALERLFLWRK